MTVKKKSKRPRRSAKTAASGAKKRGKVAGSKPTARRKLPAATAEVDEIELATEVESPAPGGRAAPASRSPSTRSAPASAAAALTSGGALHFNPGIIAEIAVREASEIEGVAELTGGWMKGRGVQIQEPDGEDDGYVIDLRLAVEYGVNCVALAETIRSRIAGAINQMTGRKTRAINVHLTGIRDRGHREEPHDEGLGEEHGIDF